MHNTLVDPFKPLLLIYSIRKVIKLYAENGAPQQRTPRIYSVLLLAPMCIQLSRCSGSRLWDCMTTCPRALRPLCGQSHVLYLVFIPVDCGLISHPASSWFTRRLLSSVIAYYRSIIWTWIVHVNARASEYLPHLDRLFRRSQTALASGQHILRHRLKKSQRGRPANDLATPSEH
jgi:hypothetical protein